MSEHVIVLDPGAPLTERSPAAKELHGGLQGKTVGIIDNTKPNFDVLAADIAELLTSEHGVVGIIKHRKRSPSTPASAAVMQDLQDKCDLVIAGSGD